ncbi:UNVERIFIED_CONTAM: hypothetical protein GTU68_063217 [Idotea baltica]|nr:hypothetical protein [Idotea baltica]
MKVPSPGESITEVEIATWLVEDGDYVEKDQPIAEVDSDKATLELPAEESGIITLKAEEGDAVAVGEVVCLIDTAAAKPEGSGDAPAKEEAPKEEKKTEGTERKKMSMLRRKVAERLVSVKNETAMLTTFNEVNMQPIFDLRSEYKEAFKAKHGVGLGFMSFFTLAVVRALKMYPDVNSMIDGDFQIKHDFQDISIAVSGPKGLMVPVIRNAENLSFRGVESEVKRLAIRARDGQITIDEMTGGTFTITNGGVFGSMLSTPIINPPQSGILGMHNIVNRPMAVNGGIVIQPIMYVALSYDHRIVDGRESVGFLVAVKEALENPVELLMDNNPTKALEM